MTDQTQSISVPGTSRSRRALGRSTWRSQPLAAWVRSRRVRRGLTTLMLLGLVAAFGWLVFRPFFHPNAQIAFLSGTDYHALEAPPVPFALEDFEAMQGRHGLTPFLARQGAKTGPLAWRNLQNPSSMGLLSQTIADAVPEAGGVMMVYVDAHGVSDDGVPYLLCRNFDPANPAAGRYPVRDLLAQFSAAPAAVKLLILDSGRIPCDPRLGMLVNEFPRLLQHEVERTGDKNLWVLNSNATFQRSHVSWALERSVFSFFVIRGLRGAADLNDDHRIDLDELFRYLTTNTAAWVREASGGRESQTPVLLWGGGPDWSQVDPPVLLPAPYDPTAGTHLPIASGSGPSTSSPSINENSPYASEVHSELSPIAKIASKNATKKVPGGKAVKRTIKTGKKVSREVQGPNQTAPAGAKEAGAVHQPANAGQPAVVPTGEAKPSAETTPAPAGPAANPPAEAAAKAEDKNSAPTAAEQKQTVAAAAPAATPAASGAAGDPATQAANLLLDAWKWRDKSEAADEEPRPLDYAPQLWHEYQSWLLAEEKLDLAGGESDPAAIADRLKALLPRLTALPHVSPLDDGQPPDLAARIAKFAPRLPAGVDHAASLAIAQLFARRGSRPLPAEVLAAMQALDRISGEGTLAEFTAWIAKLDPRLDRFAEVRLARSLAAAANAPNSQLDWPAVQLALKAERLGQQVVATDPALLPWIRRRVETADRLRLAGERTLLDGIGADRRERGSSLLRQAIDGYSQAADDSAVVAGSLQLQNDLLNRAPYYVAWYDPIMLAAAPESPRPADLLDLLDHLAALSAALDSGDPARLDQLRNLTTQMTPLVEQIESGLGEIAVAGLSSRGSVGRVSRIEALLSTPLPNAEIRDSLLVALSDADARLAKSYHPVLVPAVVEPPLQATPDQWRQVECAREIGVGAGAIGCGDWKQHCGRRRRRGRFRIGERQSGHGASDPAGRRSVHRTAFGHRIACRIGRSFIRCRGAKRRRKRRRQHRQIRRRRVARRAAIRRGGARIRSRLAGPNRNRGRCKFRSFAPSDSAHSACSHSTSGPSPAIARCSRCEAIAGCRSDRRVECRRSVRSSRLASSALRLSACRRSAERCRISDRRGPLLSLAGRADSSSAAAPGARQRTFAAHWADDR